MSAWKPSEADQRRIEVFNLTMDTELAGLATLPQAHAIALQKVIDAELAEARRITTQPGTAMVNGRFIPEGDAWPFPE